ncbi:hypothetical protein MP228_001689 [Amoeboaphelidium protococcarum]|nr:hypothetical protein MP228_001689 [Amoeboaphelidium protococcarum]
MSENTQNSVQYEGNIEDLKLDAKNVTSTTELIKNMKLLLNGLKSLDQETTDTNSLNSVTRELISPVILAHRDKTVKAIVSYCLANLLRLYAPEAPFSHSELGEIFALFISQLKYIEDVNNPYFAYSYTLLESLSTVKSIILMTELPGAEKLVLELFQDLFNNIRPTHNNNVFLCSLDILHQLCEEFTLNKAIIKVILQQFDKKNQLARPASYKLACELVRYSKDRLQHYVSQYFNDIIMLYAPSSLAGSAVPDGDSDQKDTALLDQAHSLVYELFKVTDGVLLSVIPQLDAELKVDDLQMRTLAVKTLGTLFAEKGSDLIKKYPSVWSNWLEKKNDKAVNIRLQWLDYAPQLYRFHVDMIDQLNASLRVKILDPDEKARVKVIQIIHILVKDKAVDILKAMDVGMLMELGDRCRDMKAIVRHEAIKTLGRLYNLMFDIMLSHGSDRLADQFGWIPGKLLSCLCLPEMDSAADIERSFDEDILPPNLDGDLRAHRLLFVYTSLNQQCKDAFGVLLLRQRESLKGFESFIRLLARKQEQEGKVDNELNYVVKYLSSTLPEPTKAANVLQKFAKQHDIKILKMMAVVCDVKTDYKDRLKLRKEIIKRFETSNNTVSEAQKVFSVIIRRACWTFIDQLMVPQICRIASGQIDDGSVNDAIEEAALSLVHSLSKCIPQLFIQQIGQLESLVNHQSAAIQLVGLKAMAKVLAVCRTPVKLNEMVLYSLKECMLNSSAPHAKYAAKVISYSDRESSKEVVSEIVEEVNQHLICEDYPRLASILTTASGLIKHYENSGIKSNDIYYFVINNLLKANESSVQAEEDVMVVDEMLTDELRAKLAGIRFLVMYAVVASIAQFDDWQQVCMKIVDLLVKIIEAEGDCTFDGTTCNAFKVYLRLETALGMLKMCKQLPIEQLITTEQFYVLAFVMQDPCFEVREQFLKKLLKYIDDTKIAMRYVTLPFMVAYEPIKSLYDHVKCALVKLHKNLRTNPEMLGLESVLPRLIHLLARHPDFGTSSDDLKLFVKYFEFYLSIVANNENVSYLYFIATKLKTVKDRLSDSNAIYVLADLCQLICQDLSHSHGWALISYHGSLILPPALYAPITNQAQIKANINKLFLPDDISSTYKSVKVIRTEAVSKSHNNVKPKSNETSPADAKVQSKYKKQNKAQVQDEGLQESDDDDGQSAVAEDDEFVKPQIVTETSRSKRARKARKL